MKRIRYLVVLIAAVCLSSCGVLKKDCGCPHFGKISLRKAIENIA